MPLVFQQHHPNFNIVIWQSTESFDELLRLCHLNDREAEEWEKFQSDKRKREWLTIRVLIALLFPSSDRIPTLSYTEFGKPVLDNAFDISISHTREYIAIICSPGQKVGIDLETRRERIRDLASKFISDTERVYLPNENLIEHLHVIWGAKEVLYKLYGKDGLDFRLHLLTEPFQYNGHGTLSAGIKQGENMTRYEIHYQMWNSMLLAYGISEYPHDQTMLTIL